MLFYNYTKACDHTQRPNRRPGQRTYRAVSFGVAWVALQQYVCYRYVGRHRGKYDRGSINNADTAFATAAVACRTTPFAYLLHTDYTSHGSAHGTTIHREHCTYGPGASWSDSFEGSAQQLFGCLDYTDNGVFAYRALSLTAVEASLRTGTAGFPR